MRTTFPQRALPVLLGVIAVIAALVPPQRLPTPVSAAGSCTTSAESSPLDGEEQAMLKKSAAAVQELIDVLKKNPVSVT